ncbi:FbpB family small basic protein [Lederbergia graminis]|uniref:FbpB family small basic protein n=1 Tax=Lederbergia graminis TaxID=735518 RepID=A0ABW0LIQ0_9BACI|nr:FbpB family small basic protein [Paenibacillus bovis]
MRKGKVSLSELIKINKEDLLKDKEQLEKIDKRVEEKIYESQRSES